MSGGIAPTLLLSQVANTAAWALEPSSPPHDWQTIFARVPEIENTWQTPEGRNDYLALLLAAHFTTVATFVPTDVDTRIRHHAWQDARNAEALRSSAEVIDRASAWDPREVSARVVDCGELGLVSGHDGEWLAVRAGALGRAIAIGAKDLVESISSQIEAELAREANAFTAVSNRSGQELQASRLATVLAHNTGDLSRVVDAWPTQSSTAQAFKSQYIRLGHDGEGRYEDAFRLAGHLNKALMAAENHRFLAMRKPRTLRGSRALLLPIGPFFDEWGESLGRNRAVDSENRGAILAALLEGHESAPTQLGYLRAMAGLHRTNPGGIEAVAREVPARARKLVASGPIREALRLDAERFEARMVNRYRAAASAFRGG